MPTATHTLQGPDLEALLARVPAELGPDATIVAANKLRSGGIGGFFAREQFEVVVEVPESAAAPKQAPAGRRRTAPLTAPDDPAAGPAPSAPRVSTEAVGFAGVLDRMVRDAGADDFAPRPVGPALTPRAGVTVAPPAGGADAGPQDDAAEDDDLAFEPLVPTRLPRPTPPPAPALPTSVPLPVASPAPVPAAAPVPVPVAAPAAPSLDQRWLARIGIPTNVAAHLTTVSDDPMVELFHLLDRLALPEPLPSGQGAVIAVVGRRTDALEVAEAFAAELGTSPDEILVAATSFRGTGIDEDRRVTSIDLAMERRRSWRRRRQPTIIAVDASLGRARGTWAAHLLDAVEPTMVWGVVEATRKAEDIRDWAERLGGLDALAVTDLEETVSPAAVLGAGVPVGLLDGHPATASRWTAILAEHLELAA